MNGCEGALELDGARKPRPKLALQGLRPGFDRAARRECRLGEADDRRAWGVEAREGLEGWSVG